MSLTPAASVAIVFVFIFALVAAVAWYFHTQVTMFARVLLGIRRKVDDEEQVGAIEGQQNQQQELEVQMDRSSTGTQTTLA